MINLKNTRISVYFFKNFKFWIKSAKLKEENPRYRVDDG